jgi:hypothetical protein
VLQGNQLKPAPNPLGHEEAIQLVSQLRKGMQQQGVERFLVANNLRPHSTTGNSAHWISSVALNDGTSLQVLYSAGDHRANDDLSGGLLGGAWIHSTNRLDGATERLFRGSRFYQKPIALAGSF